MVKEPLGARDGLLTKASSNGLGTLPLLGFVTGTLLIPAIAFAVATAVGHHAAVQLASENIVPLHGLCPGWRWYVSVHPMIPCAMLNDATTLQVASSGFSMLALVGPAIVVVLAFLLSRRTRLLGTFYDPLMMVCSILGALAVAGQLALIIASGWLGANYALGGHVGAGVLAVFVLPILSAIPIVTGIGIGLRSWGEGPVFALPLSPKQAPNLWMQVKVVAQAVGVPPPDNLLIGLSPLCFATRSKLTIPERRTILRGRTIHVPALSLHLLSCEELRACLGHELAHFRRGLSPVVIRLALQWSSWRSSDAAKAASAGGFSAFALFLFPGISTLLLMLHYLSKFAAAGFPAFEFAADRFAVLTTSEQTALRGLIKHAIIMIATMPTGQSTPRKESDEMTHPTPRNPIVDLSEKIRSSLTSASPADVRAWIEKAEAKYPSPFHPSLGARATAWGVDLDQAIAAVLLSLDHGASPYVSESSPIELDLARLHRAGTQLDTGEEISPRDRVRTKPAEESDV